MDERIDVIDFVINALKEHEKKLDALVGRLEELLTKTGNTPQPDKSFNVWAELDFKLLAYDHVNEKFGNVSVLELSDEDFRRFVCWKLGMLGKRSGE